jgi:murein DD-endopeptidase MepM/ murein hydrolase activator NlpD
MAVAESSVNGLADVLRNVPTSRDHAKLLEKRVSDFEKLEKRVLALESTQHADMIELEERTVAEIERIEKALKRTGQKFDPMVNSFMIANAPDTNGVAGQGGPFIGMQHEDLENTNLEDADIFFQRAFRISERLQKLAALNDTITALPITRPVNIFRVSSGYGPRHDPMLNRIGMHAGIDFAGRKGTPVVATAAGKVIKSGYGSGYGNMVQIDHGNGYMSTYAHLSKRNVKKGQSIKRGEKIGAVGNTGRSTGPHLHYEIRYKGGALNPMKFLEAGRYVFENQG